MKKYIAFFALATALFTAGCSLDRIPLTGPSTGTFPASFDEAQAGVLAAYKSLANNIEQYEPFPNRWMDQLTDIGAMRTVLSKWPDYTQSTITSSYSGVEHFYARIYKSLGRIHLVLDNLDNLRGKIEDEEYYRFKAELLCLRAYFYDWACKVYGDVPFIDHCLTLDDYAYARTPKAEVIDRIIKDMDNELIDHLPVSWGSQTWGTARIGRVAAYALKARICLEWGFFESAARCSKRALELADGVYDLTPLDCTYYATHAEGEPDPTPLFGFAAETGSKEWIWGHPVQPSGGFQHPHRHLHGNLPRPQRRRRSRPVDGDDGHLPVHRRQADFGIGTLRLAEPVEEPRPAPRPLLRTFRLADDGHPVLHRSGRQDRLRLHIGHLRHQLRRDRQQERVRSERHSGSGRIPLAEILRPAYYGSITGTGYEDELDVPIIRLAELLLIDAEANIEWDGGDLARAKSQIDRVRARVKMPPVEGSSREALRSALRYERKVELCAEGFRWFDIRRWKESDGKTPVALKAINGPQYAPAYEHTTSNAKPIIDENWTVTYDGVTTFDGKKFDARVHTERKFQLGKDELWPFPYSEMVTNPLIGTENNNPGY